MALLPHVNTSPIDCTDVLSLCISLQNHKTIISHLTDFIPRNILYNRLTSHYYKHRAFIKLLIEFCCLINMFLLTVIEQAVI